MLHISNLGLKAPNAGIDSSKNTCHTTSQPRRRPSGGVKRSNSGAHKNFQVNGRLIKANRPIDFKSTPSERNHAGSRLIKINSGNPELNPVNTQMSIFLLISDCLIVGCAVVGDDIA